MYYFQLEPSRSYEQVTRKRSGLNICIGQGKTMRGPGSDSRVWWMFNLQPVRYNFVFLQLWFPPKYALQYLRGKNMCLASSSNAPLHYMVCNIQNGIVLCSWRVADKTVEHWLEASREAKRIKLLAHKASRGLSHQDRDRNSAFIPDIKTISINFYACYLRVVAQTYWVWLNKIFPEWTQLGYFVFPSITAIEGQWNFLVVDLDHRAGGILALSAN